MADVLRIDVPPETPSTLRRTGGIVIGIAAILGAVGYGFSQIPPTHDKALAAGRSLHFCSPEPPSDIQPFQSGWLGSGSTFASAVKDTLSGYRANIPTGTSILLRAANIRGRTSGANPAIDTRGPFV
jgi:hypothetical protein